MYAIIDRLPLPSGESVQSEEMFGMDQEFPAVPSEECVFAEFGQCVEQDVKWVSDFDSSHFHRSCGGNQDESEFHAVSGYFKSLI